MTVLQVPEFRHLAEAVYDVAIVGLGYVGLPTALSFHAAGARVVGIDIDPGRLAAIRDGGVDLLPSDQQRLREALEADSFHLTVDASRKAEASTVVICVPTPVTRELTPDLQALKAACATVVERAVPGQRVILTSTTYVGCTEDLLVHPLAERGLRAGTDIAVAFSPERIDPGNDGYAHEDVPRVVGGMTPLCTAAAVKVLSRSSRSLHQVSSPRAAEMAKLLENIFRAVNISLANEFADASRSLGLDVMEVIDAAATKPYGFMPFYPGPGIGGHCIPCDPHYLLWQMRRERLNLPVVAAAMAGIAERPRQIVDRVRDVLSDHRKGLRGARVLVVGITYKPGVKDLRESPALEIMEELDRAGAEVFFSDELISTVTVNGKPLHSVDLDTADVDLVLVHTMQRRDPVLPDTEKSLVLDATYWLKVPGSTVP
jgi:nucleotide sugar dehydrogenase